MKQTSQSFLASADAAMAQPQLRETMQALGTGLPALRSAAMEQLGNFEELRQHLKAVKQHTLTHLEHYLVRYEEQVHQRGGHVHWARGAEELNSIVLDICRQRDARHVVKGKSMVTEETDLTAQLQAAGLEVTETDLGEYIIQLAGEYPSHIVGPALHKSQAEIRELFLQEHSLGERELEDVEALVQEAREVLRQRFLNADVGITGANALIAEDGRSMLVTNEGNGDLASTLPKVQIVCATIDKLLPRPEDATAMLRLLSRSAVGTVTSAYASFYTGPRHDDDLDGPDEYHVILLDNQRTDMLDTNYEEMLGCMRCGACLNHCPIYMAAGGHAYGWVYPGPMGSVLTPLLTGLEQANSLPNACTACGRCAEVCPAAIPLPDLLRDLRAEEHQRGLSPLSWRSGLKLHSLLARSPGLYRQVTAIGIGLLRLLARGRGQLQSIVFDNGWTEVRDLPRPQGKTFMQQYRSASKNKATDDD
ncbi:iron-sulfur cluster-binding protein [Halieaceae bacterium IMCC14734]|uniref:Iron-sulfur cluster-binding protein n=1 Tax=Candidatus Litorirhabdus singularis TaxID=2518993 RepID=A0ABT3TFE0_9GAMM|nr:LutB/LldF family L-lactate oxidation iron-sulfur protein [Candidatus Litorirhabdus singularis]MCX2981028.1 iron-sulfur cluster-binding protein [Candidatus Litorirhabdus singularis]